ncbi:hypothetical protein Tco_0716504 [Tanacetum coccineum]
MAPPYLVLLLILWSRRMPTTLFDAASPPARNSLRYCRSLCCRRSWCAALLAYSMELMLIGLSRFSTILAKDPLPNVKEPFNIVSRKESQRGLHPDVSCGNNVSFLVKTKNNANNSYRKVNNNNNNNNSNRGLNPNLLCKNCGLIDHTVERCYELIGYLAGFKKNSTLLIPIE